MELKAGEAATESKPAKRTVLGLWPILLSLSIAATMAVTLMLGFLFSSRTSAQSDELQRSAIALVPIAILIGLSGLIAKYLPQTTAKPWLQVGALWASFAGVLVIAIAVS